MVHHQPTGYRTTHLESQMSGASDASGVVTRPLSPPSKYLPGIRFSLPGTLLLLVILCIVAVPLGIAYAAVGWGFKYIIFSPIVGGICLGYVGGFGPRISKVHCGWYACGCGCLAGLLMLGTSLVTDSQYYRRDMVVGLESALMEARRIDPDIARKAAEHYLTPKRTFTTYMRYRAWSGISVGHVGIQASQPTWDNRGGGLPKLTLAGPFYWLMLGVEALIMGLAAGIKVGIRAEAPFCEKCRRWYESWEWHRAERSRAREIVGLVKAGDWEAIGNLPGTPEPTIGTSIRLARCTRCGEATLEVATKSESARTPLLHVRILPEDADYLESVADQEE